MLVVGVGSHLVNQLMEKKVKTHYEVHPPHMRISCCLYMYKTWLISEGAKALSRSSRSTSGALRMSLPKWSVRDMLEWKGGTCKWIKLHLDKNCRILRAKQGCDHDWKSFTNVNGVTSD